MTTTDIRLPGDELVFHALNGIKQPMVDAIMVFASSREFGVACLIFAAVWVIGGLRRHAIRPILQAAVAMTISDRVGHEVLKPWIARTRPCFALPAGTFRKLVDVGISGSMPSLHAANAFAVATALTLVWPMVGRVFFPIAALIAVSRVFVGVHWPSDVLFGAMFGSAVALLIHLLVSLVLPKRPGQAPTSRMGPASGTGRPSDR